MAADATRVSARRGAAPRGWIHWPLLLLVVGDWIALRNGVWSHSPWLLAGLVGVLLVALAARVWMVLPTARRGGPAPGRTVAEIAVLAGLLVALAAGSANWLLGIQAFVILLEGEAVPLHGGAHLQQIDAGPLSRVEDLHLSLALRDLDLRSTGPGAFVPESRLEMQRGDEEPLLATVNPTTHIAELGALHLYQGAFGYAPRIVILRGGETVFDRVVPFTTERRGPGGVSFQGLFTIERESLEVEGAVDLRSLDEGMRGHATLVLEVRKEDRVLGRGSLLPGHFAELEEGYRIGFADLESWSEIVISRRNYGRFVQAGGVLALVGLVLWPLAAWRRW